MYKATYFYRSVVISSSLYFHSSYLHSPFRFQIPSHRKPPIERALRDFNMLLNDKRSLLIFIRSMEEQRGFTIRDKSIVGSLLIVALHNKMDYATE